MPGAVGLGNGGAMGDIDGSGLYYRDHVSGGYEVVPTLLASSLQVLADEQPLVPPAENPDAYPRQGQSADHQGSDADECHRWAVQQTGFDPSGAALGVGRGTSVETRAGFPRARIAYLEGRGYSVR